MGALKFTGHEIITTSNSTYKFKTFAEDLLTPVSLGWCFTKSTKAFKAWDGTLNKSYL